MPEFDLECSPGEVIFQRNPESCFGPRHDGTTKIYPADFTIPYPDGINGISPYTDCGISIVGLKNEASRKHSTTQLTDWFPFQTAAQRAALLDVRFNGFGGSTNLLSLA